MFPQLAWRRVVSQGLWERAYGAQVHAVQGDPFRPTSAATAENRGVQARSCRDFAADFADAVS
jgi:hypothetical protein